ncbi:MAG: GNAT family N-acetyltransferase [Oleispira sp.]|nr:GNAT family N-acetyltransferase [Oleispira sp.]
MSVRRGTEADIPAIVEMSIEFWSHTAFDEPACPESIRDMVELCLSHGLLSVVDIDGPVGFAAGVMSPLLGNKTATIGTELAWWVNPEHRSGTNGIRLLKHLEGLAKEAGIKYWCMAYMESSMPEKVKCMYEKMGYKKTESAYMRTL